MSGNGLGLALQHEFDPLGHDRIAHEPDGLLAEQYIARACLLLQTRGHVDGVTRHERVPATGDHLAGVDPDPCLEPELMDASMQLHGRPNRAQRVILRGDRDPEDRHHGVSHELSTVPPCRSSTSRAPS